MKFSMKMELEIVLAWKFIEQNIIQWVSLIVIMDNISSQII